MFTSAQILTSSKLVKNFKEVSKRIQKNPQALLITQKSKDPLVLVDARLYESLLRDYYEDRGYLRE